MRDNYPIKIPEICLYQDRLESCKSDIKALSRALHVRGMNRAMRSASPGAVIDFLPRSRPKHSSFVFFPSLTESLPRQCFQSIFLFHRQNSRILSITGNCHVLIVRRTQPRACISARSLTLCPGGSCASLTLAIELMITVGNKGPSVLFIVGYFIFACRSCMEKHLYAFSEFFCPK